MSPRRLWDPLGDRAIRFTRPPSSPRAIVRAVRSWPGVVDVVVAREDVAAYFDRTPHIDDAAIAALAILADVSEHVREHMLPARYDGPDLDSVARQANLTTAEVVAIHSAATYDVDLVGFVPGFAYLRNLDSRLVIPRRATPRSRVPAGSLAIAGENTAVYPFESPGGWHLIGRVATPMFGPKGALLALGDRVRFIEAT